MRVKELIAILQKFNPDTEVTMTIEDICDLKVKNVDAFFGDGNANIERVNLVLKQ